MAVFAESGPLTLDPPALTVAGTLGGGTFAASLRLLPTSDIGGVRIVASDLTDATGDSFLRDPLPSSAVTLLPASEFITLTAGSLTQVLVQVAPPPVAGTYTGTLLIHWMKPTPGSRVVPLTVVARTQPALAVQSDTQLTFSGTRAQTLRQQVILRETTLHGSPLTGLRVLPRDLRSAEGAVLPASQIRAILPAFTLAGGSLLTGTLELSLTEARAGTYTGDVLFVYDAGAPVQLPLTVNVKHGPGWAILVLVIGSVLGLLIAHYQGKGKTSDTLVVRIVRVREAMQKPGGPQASFLTQLELWVSKAESALRLEDEAVASAAVQKAEELLSQWHQADWATPLNRLQQLTEQVKEPSETAHPDAIAYKDFQIQAQTLSENVLAEKSPGAFAEKILDLESKLNDFQYLCQRFESVNQMRNDLAKLMTDEWQPRLADLQYRLMQLRLGDEKGTRLAEDLNVLGQEMLDALEATQQKTASLESDGVKSPGERGATPLDMLLEKAKGLLKQERRAVMALATGEKLTVADAQEAGERIQWHRRLTYVVGGILLAVVGYATLYWTNATFGARPADYLALFAWGLGAQTSFADAAKLLQGLGIPFGKAAQ